MINKAQPLTNLEQLLDRIHEAAAKEGNAVSLGTVLETVGRRSFGALLLVAGLITLAPIIGDIPGVPTIIGGAGQLLFGREYFWLPHWLLKRSVATDKLYKALDLLRPVARFIDRLLRPRLTQLTNARGFYAIALISITIAATMPVLEFIPFSANGAGAAFLALGLSLIARDGLLALLVFIFTAIALGWAVLVLLL